MNYMRSTDFSSLFSGTRTTVRLDQRQRAGAGPRSGGDLFAARCEGTISGSGQLFFTTGHQATDGVFSTRGARSHLIGPSQPGQSSMSSSAHLGDICLLGMSTCLFGDGWVGGWGVPSTPSSP